MSLLVKGTLALEFTAKLLPLPDVDGSVTGVGAPDMVLLVLLYLGVAAVDFCFLFRGGITPISTSFSVLELQLSSKQSNQTELYDNALQRSSLLDTIHRFLTIELAALCLPKGNQATVHVLSLLNAH